MIFLCEQCNSTDVVTVKGVHVCRKCGCICTDEETMFPQITSNMNDQYTQSNDYIAELIPQNNNYLLENQMIQSSKLPAILSLVFGILATILFLLYQYTFVDAIGLWAILTGIAGVVLGMYGYLKTYVRGIAVAGTLISTLVLCVFFTMLK